MENFHGSNNYFLILRILTICDMAHNGQENWYVRKTFPMSSAMTVSDPLWTFIYPPSIHQFTLDWLLTCSICLDHASKALQDNCSIYIALCSNNTACITASSSLLVSPSSSSSLSTTKISGASPLALFTSMSNKNHLRAIARRPTSFYARHQTAVTLDITSQISATLSVPPSPSKLSTSCTDISSRMSLFFRHRVH